MRSFVSLKTDKSPYSVIKMKDKAKLQGLSGLCVTVTTHRQITADIQLYVAIRSLAEQLKLVVSRPDGI